MTPKESCEKEFFRFFNKYYKFCSSSDSDDLKELLSSLCSSFEKLKKVTKEKLKSNKRFIALKALRNFATHESELLNESKALGLHSPTVVQSDVKLLCLVPKNTIEYVLNNLHSKFTINCVKKNFTFYKEFVDIYPALFNSAVDLYFLAERHLLKVEGQGYASISQSIEYEKANGYQHHIDGKIIMLDGTDVNNFLSTSIISMNDKNHENSSLYVDENAFYRVSSLYSTSPIEQASSMKAEDKKHILNKLISTKAIKIETNDDLTPVAYMNRELTPIEVVIAQEYVESLNLTS